jgi:hypothetical protein
MVDHFLEEWAKLRDADSDDADQILKDFRMKLNHRLAR